MSDVGLVLLGMWGRIRFWWHSAGPGVAREKVPLRLSELAERIAWQTPLVKPALDWIVAEAFPYRPHDKELFELESDDTRLRSLAARLISPTHSDRIYGRNTYDLSGFFRQELLSLFTQGQAFVRIYWTGEEAQNDVDEDQGSEDGPGTVRHLTRLRCSGVRVLGSPDKPDGYEVDPSRAHWWGLPSDWKGKSPYRLQPDQMLALRWPSSTHGQHRSPVLAVVPEYWEMVVGMHGGLSSAYAAAHPEDHSIRAEAARYRDMKLSERQPWVDTRAHWKVGGSLLAHHALAPTLTRPMTKYYEAWQHVEARKQITRLRDYLLAEFTRQVLVPLALRNGLPPVARLKAKEFLSEADMDGIFARFAHGEIDMDEFGRLTHEI